MSCSITVLLSETLRKDLSLNQKLNVLAYRLASKFPGSVCLCPKCCGHRHMVMTDFYMDVGNLNSGPCKWLLPTESHPQTTGCILERRLVHTYNTSIWEADAGGPGVTAQSKCHSELEDSLAQKDPVPEHIHIPIETAKCLCLRRPLNQAATELKD